ncbi:ENHANCED DOWNY MILDEW 2 [Euphorbia peplus]|nr:ENHANCED DOWNY MILDEW 2 [Euphorbia peplus]
MASSDDEADVGPQSVSNYHFVDDDDAPTSFSDLPLYDRRSDDDNDNDVRSKNREQIFVHGSADNGLQTIHKEVIAWKFDLFNAKPEISVLTKDKNWIELQKPRKSFEEIIRTVLITVQCLHFARRNPDASEKSVWDHLSKVFSSYEVIPSQNDLVDHMALISEALEQDKSLAKSKFLLTFHNKKPRKRKLSNEDVKPTDMSGFIVDHEDDEMFEDSEDGDKEEDVFDSACAFCDNGGDILCCEGNCLRSFHPTVEDGVDSKCVSLGFSKREVEAINSFYCKNCEYKQHQCFACGELGSSDKSSGAEVFQCASATCGHFYHPDCVAELLYPGNKVAAKELEKNIAAGHGFFTCPMHKCCVCRQGEDKQIKELQFAVCRRCPTSYHRKCLPKGVLIEKKKEGEDDEEEEEDEEEEDGEIRAWEGLLPGRLLFYCLKHEIDEELSTPIRDIKFPSVAKKREARLPEMPGSSGKVLSNKRKLISKDSFSERTIMKEEWEPPVKKVATVKRSENISSGLNPLRKVKENVAFRKPMKGSITSDATEVKKFAKDNVRKTSLGDRLFALVSESSEAKVGKQEMRISEPDNSMTRKASTKKLSSELPSLDADAERSMLALMKEVESSITLEDVLRKRKAPSTHTSSLKYTVEKTITAGKVEGAVQAVRTALEKLEAGCSPEDVKAICEPEVLHQIYKWKNKLSVYLAPFLRGKRYTSFGRHFTKVEKLEKIVDMLHWYTNDGDMIVDFCCGANDFSCLMKKKLEETGKKCSYKNYDLIQPKIDFNFEKRDWMTVKPEELPKRGSQLIMGLNPPFGVKASLANKFINQALKFKPKLLILIVPPETERLDKKNPPYDLVWEDNQFLSGKSFYLPGSVDENDKQMDQWNLTTPPLYLWSRRDWTKRHRDIAQEHGHASVRQKQSSLENCLYDGNASELTDQLHMHNKEPSHKESVPEDHRECSPCGNVIREKIDSDAPETLGNRKHVENKLGRRINEKLPENIQDDRKSPRSDSCKDGRSSKEGTASKSPEMLLHAKAVENRPPSSEHRKSSSDMSLDSDSSKGLANCSSSKVVDGKSSWESTVTKSPETLLHAGAVANRLPNLDCGKSNSSRRSRRRKNSYKGIPRRPPPPKVVRGKSSREGNTSKSPEILEHRKSSLHMPSGRAYSDSIHNDASRNYSTKYYRDSRDFHGSSHANMDHHSGAATRESTESVGLTSYPTELGMDLDALSQVPPRYDSVQRNYVGQHEPSYGQIGTLPSMPSGNFSSVSESYRMSMPGMPLAPESYRMNMSATQRYAPRLDEFNRTRMNNMGGPDPSMLNTSDLYNPLQPQSGYNGDPIGFAPGPRHPYPHHNSTGWIDD